MQRKISESMSISHSCIKYIRSLDQKKVRRIDKVFLAEGPKIVSDLLGAFHCRMLVSTEEWLKAHPNALADEVFCVTSEELSRASLLRTPQQVLAVFSQPTYSFDISLPQQSLCLALDGVQDPGNLGTIIRVADWFGIEHIFCSMDTVEVYNPKVVQATMGAIARVKTYYTSLKDFISQIPDVPVYGTFLDGDNIYNESLSTNGLIIMGNEGNGISEEIASLVNKRLFIPNYPIGRPTSESLNVAIATSIICAEFRRRCLV